MATQTLWNKFNSNADLITPTIGSAFTANGAVTFPVGYFSNSIEFAGSSYLSSANVIPPIFTIEFWVNPNIPIPAVSHRRWVGNTITAVNGNTVMIREDNATQIQVYYGTGTIISGIPFTRRTWTHVALTFNGTKLFLYKNGADVTGGGVTPTAPMTPSANVYVGGYFYSMVFPSEYFFGRIDNLKIFDYAKTDFSDRFYEDGVIPSVGTWNSYTLGGTRIKI